MAEYHGKHYDPDFICQDDYEWLTDTGRYTSSGSKTCEVCQQEPALYNIDFTTATGYDGKLTCPTCTDLLKEQHPYGVVVPLLACDKAIANETRNNPPCPHRDDYEWNADPDQEISQRAVFIRYCLNKQCDAVLCAKMHIDDALRVAHWEVPYTVAILALEAVQEVLSQQLAHLCTRIALISTYPRTGYYDLVPSATCHLSSERVHICSGCRDGWCVGCIPDTDLLNEMPGSNHQGTPLLIGALIKSNHSHSSSKNGEVGCNDV